MSQHSDPALSSAPAVPSEQHFWPAGWWRIMEFRIGPIPLPVYVVLLALIAYFLRAPGNFPTELAMMLAVLAVGGFTCFELGKRTPLLKKMGGSAIFAVFLPSIITYYGLLPQPIVSAVTAFIKTTLFFYVFIAVIIVGSILAIDRKVLIAGFVKIFLPLALGATAALGVGMAVGRICGLTARYTAYYIVVPIMSGGIAEGAIPLSVGYANMLHVKEGDEYARVLPAVMVGGLVAVLFAGALNWLGKRRPQLTGDGRLQPGERDEIELKKDEAPQSDFTNIVAGGCLAIACYLMGMAFFRWLHWPAPLVLIVLAVALKVAHAVPPKLQNGSFFVYKLFTAGVTYPLLFAFGVGMTPWNQIVSAFAPANLVTIVAVVATHMAVGFGVARWIKVYPVEMAIINSSNCAMGGAGVVAILSAAERMELMPFSQIAVRIGGLIVVTLALSSLVAIAAAG